VDGGEQMIYAKIMPSPITKNKIIVSVFCGNGWMGFAKKMDEYTLDFRLTCKDLSSAWEFSHHTQVTSWMLSMQNLGLDDIEIVTTSSNAELTEL
jgi:hypothetical protein